MGGSAGGQRLPSGGLAGQGGSTPTGDITQGAIRPAVMPMPRPAVMPPQGNFDPTKGTGYGGRGIPPITPSVITQSEIGMPAPQPTGLPAPPQPNPFQQAARAQSDALATTRAATQYQTSPTAMGRMAAGMAYAPPTAATGALTANTSYAVSPTAQGGFERAIGYGPQQVGATSYQAAQQATPVTAASAMQGYQNPYETQVVQQTLRDIGTQAQMGQENLDAQAQRAKAFGGSRHGVAQAEAMKNYNQQMADAAARMRQQGFQTQLGAGQFDVGQQTAAEARNVAAENVARQFGAQQGMTAQQLNQAAGLQGANLNLQGAQAMSNADLAAAQERRASGTALGNMAAQAEQLGMGAAGQVAGAQRADVGTRMGAANQLGGLGQQSFGYGQSIQQQQMQQGALQRALMQGLIDAGQQNFGTYTGAPTSGLNTLIGTLTGVPQGTSTSFQPGLFNYLQLGASMFPR